MFCCKTIASNYWIFNILPLLQTTLECFLVSTEQRIEEKFCVLLLGQDYCVHCVNGPPITLITYVMHVVFNKACTHQQSTFWELNWTYVGHLSVVREFLRLSSAGLSQKQNLFLVTVVLRAQTAGCSSEWNAVSLKGNESTFCSFNLLKRMRLQPENCLVRQPDTDFLIFHCQLLQLLQFLLAWALGQLAMRANSESLG